MNKLLQLLRESRLSLMQISALAFIHSEGNVRESDLADYLQRQQTQTHALLGRLTALGFVRYGLVHNAEASRPTPLYRLTRRGDLAVDSWLKSIQEHETA